MKKYLYKFMSLFCIGLTVMSIDMYLNTHSAQYILASIIFFVMGGFYWVFADLAKPKYKVRRYKK